ncbi:hypothetical protein AB0F52_11460 [Amycolatopsis sp. NPDC024027]|uniref:hypothetical protein n=1 Tax=Amycolatopsis sp. NPDC024027 TaxID=3154327 RepID=UPI0033EC8A0F
MKRNLKRAAVYGVAGLATAAIGASTASALAEDGQENHDVKPVPAAPQAAAVPQQAPPAVAAPPARIAAPQHTVDGPKQPEPPRHVVPAAPHRPAVAAARPILPKPPAAKHAKSPSRPRSSVAQKTVDASTTRYIVRAAAQASAPAVKTPEVRPSPAATTDQGLDEAVKAVGVAHQAVRDAEKTFDEAGKALHQAKDTLGKTKADLKRIRDGLKTGKRPCDDAPVRVKRTQNKHGKVVSKTASVTSGGVSASSTATATNGTVSATAW